MPHTPQAIDERASDALVQRPRSPLLFFLLVFTLSIPVWLIGAQTGFQLAPGLPVSALAAFCPAIAASILLFKERRVAGVIELLKRSFDHDRIRARAWYVAVILLMPAVAVLSYALMRIAGMTIPSPHFPVLLALMLFLVAFVAALGEELGWSGYAIDPMQARWGALTAALLLGAVWAIWHWAPLLQVHRSPAWIAWWSIGTLARRVLTVWLYNNTGRSVFAAALFHAMSNVSWQLFPNFASHWDPRVDALVTASLAAVVTIAWGPRTLARYRNV